jgi:hypothetical protein
MSGSPGASLLGKSFVNKASEDSYATIVKFVFRIQNLTVYEKFIEGNFADSICMRYGLILGAIIG